ncbi:TPA: Rid family hydrolase [Stenotrophomonas maltophilia]
MSASNGKTASFDTMEAQMRRTYENAQVPLAELGGSLADVVEETLFVIDVPAAFAASGKVRPAVYGQPVPQVASNLIGVPALAFPEQLIEIAFRAEVQSWRQEWMGAYAPHPPRPRRRPRG